MSDMIAAARSLLIVNPNTNEETTRLLVATARSEAAGTGAIVRGVTAAAGPRMITDPVALAAAEPHVVAAARRAVAEGDVDAIVVGAYGDPGVDRVAEATGLPVVGIGAASVRTAAGGGRRFAIATTTSLLVDAMRELARRNDVLDSYVGCYLTDSPADELDDPGRLVDELRAAALRAHADGAEAIVIGGGPLSAAAGLLAAETGAGLRIVEPVREAVREALALVAAAPPVR
jgi:Asp/Glu/hydantoin racemase